MCCLCVGWWHRAVLNREVRDFARAAMAVQRETGCTVHQAKEQVMQWLGTEMPPELEFNAALNGTPARHRRGRPAVTGLTKRDALAAVAVYFESIGARPEQAIIEARRWLGIALSRHGAKAAVTAYKVNTSPNQYKHQAMCAYLTYKQGTTLPLPACFEPRRRKRGRGVNLN